MTPLMILFIALNVADAVLTERILRKGGRELNPVMRWAMEKIGVIPALGIGKAVAVALVAVFAQEVMEAMIALCVLYAGIVANNIRVMVKQ